MRVRIKENRRVNMRARIPILSEKDKKKIVAEAERELEKKWKQREDELSVELTRRIIKVFYLFGPSRAPPLKCQLHCDRNCRGGS